MYPKGLFWALFFFLLYINDIVSDISSNIRLFADDTCLFILVENPGHVLTVDCLNRDLDKITQWAMFVAGIFQSI